MANFFSNHDGTIKSVFQVSGLHLENDGSALKVTSDGATLATASVATPTLNEHAATKAYVDAQNASQAASQQVAYDTHAAIDGDGQFKTAVKLPVGASVLRVTLDVTTAYDQPSTIKLGIAGDAEAFLASGEIDLTIAGTYMIDVAYTNAGPSEAEFQIDFTGGVGLSVGQLRVFYSYVTTPAV